MRGEQEKNCFEQIKKLAIKKADMQLLRYWNKAVANSDSNAFTAWQLIKICLNISMNFPNI